MKWDTNCVTFIPVEKVGVEIDIDIKKKIIRTFFLEKKNLFGNVKIG